MKVLLVTIFLFICSMHINQVRADTLVTYYDDSFYRGERNTVNLDAGCINLSYFEDRISSIDTRGNCVKVFNRHNCQGDSRRIEPGSSGHSNLKDVDFNDRISSLRRC